VDLHGDGHLDLISGSWPGEIFLFRGGAKKGTFAAPEMIKDKEGKIINIGGGIHEQPDGSILITGNAEFEETPEGTIVKYQGKRFKSTAAKPVLVTGCASAVHAVDWNGDGLIDLLVGDIGGNVYLIPNEGTKKAYAFGKPQPLQAGGKPVHVEGDAGPFVADWDGDGRPDLLVGSGDGSVWFYRNIGNGKVPELAAGVRLVAPGETTFGPDCPKEPRRGIRAKVCAVDWFGTGRLDLLVGDMATQKPNLPTPTAEQKPEQDRLREKLNKIQERYRQLVEQVVGAKREQDDNKLKQVRKQLQEVLQEMQNLRSKIPAEYEMHGWVWLFQRKPLAKTTAAK
jgi:hypothetical protein